jgi:hypothetical protein
MASSITINEEQRAVKEHSAQTSFIRMGATASWHRLNPVDPVPEDLAAPNLAMLGAVVSHRISLRVGRKSASHYLQAPRSR